MVLKDKLGLIMFPKETLLMKDHYFELQPFVSLASPSKLQKPGKHTKTSQTCCVLKAGTKCQLKFPILNLALPANQLLHHAVERQQILKAIKLGYDENLAVFPTGKLAH